MTKKPTHSFLPFPLVALAIFSMIVSACSNAPDAIPTPNPNIVRLTPSQDATLFEDADGELASSVSLSNFVGMTNRNMRRRMLLAFDVSALPSDREIISVALEMRMSKSASSAFDVALHRVTSPWSEGTSAASGMGGKGSSSSPGDPTWIHSTYPNTPWTTPGGDFVAEPSAITSIDNFVRYSWSSAGLIDDVRTWATGAEPNLGWIAIGNEVTQKTAKRFDSREHTAPSRRPTLVIELTPLPKLTDQ